MGINNIQALHGGEEPEVIPTSNPIACPNTHIHGPHNWGERGKFYYCEGIAE